MNLEEFSVALERDEPKLSDGRYTDKSISFRDVQCSFISDSDTAESVFNRIKEHTFGLEWQEKSSNQLNKSIEKYLERERDNITVEDYIENLMEFRTEVREYTCNKIMVSIYKVASEIATEHEAKLKMILSTAFDLAKKRVLGVLIQLEPEYISVIAAEDPWAGISIIKQSFIETAIWKML